ncbi:MAG TPA: ASKHA domain-containing protein, partial [Candidatus Avimonas sp.]|nr:ASKHA domain-containing protein [Candidatus Avimonas sp.]
GFGSRLDIKSAEKIGLIPPGFSKKAYAIGNAAGSGASMLLLSEILRIQSEQIAGLAKTVELSTHPYFMEKYIDGMYFPGV